MVFKGDLIWPCFLWFGLGAGGELVRTLFKRMGQVMETSTGHTRPGGMSVPVSSSVLSQHPPAKLRRLDLSGNSISFIHSDALRLLPALQDLILPENQLAALPVLPSGIEFLDVRLNQLQSSGIQPEAFVVSQDVSLLPYRVHHTHVP